MLEQDTIYKEDGLVDIKEKILADLEQSRREKKEITLMLEQSQVDIHKLAQRNAAITTHLQQIYSQFENMPREDIRMAYDSALDTQQRLLVMRGQVEKLQSDQIHLSKYIEIMDKVIHWMDHGSISGQAGSTGIGTLDTIEMAIQVQEAERLRLSRQMHDGPAQTLSNFILQTEIAMRLFDVDQEKAKQELEALRTAATNSFRKIRDFIYELRPMMLDDLGLAPTLKRYIDAYKQQTSTNVLLSITGVERRLVSYEEVMIFRAIQELLSNVAQHSQAVQIKVHLDMAEEKIQVAVDDDGKGFAVDSLTESRGVGLKVIRDRVALLGGEIQIESTPGQGTRVSFQVPALAV
ncbi:MAG: sensor histidine kinase [Methanosarcinaceae archaeon]|nr:sensor histidine kinase [Methanosarcinaceae archaeon]